MSNGAILLWMIFMHIVDDYYLQGVLATMKQKKWWRKQESYEDKYKYDYIVALFMHAISWTLMIMLPIAYALSFNLPVGFYIFVGVNTVLHATIDDLKANKLKINLVVDQSLHMLQIIITFIQYIKFWGVII